MLNLRSMTNKNAECLFANIDLEQLDKVTGGINESYQSTDGGPFRSTQQGTNGGITGGERMRSEQTSGPNGGIVGGTRN
jgi:hypothetical protein